MAKVDTIKLSIKGVEYSYDINVGKTGVFRCRLDCGVAETLGIDGDQKSETLSDLKNAILSPYHDYLEAAKTEELFISIRYKASGEFALDDRGFALFEHPSEFLARGFASDSDGFAFRFGVFLKETSPNGDVLWFETRKGSRTVYHDEEDQQDPGKYYKGKQTFNPKGKLIPYSPEAYQTLLKATEGIRKISNILHSVVSQDEEKITAILQGGNLLTAKTSSSDISVQ